MNYSSSRSRMSRCILATQMRSEGFSGAQTHAAAVLTLARKSGWDAKLVTPFSGRSILRSVVFSVRYVLRHLSGTLDVFWYRAFHGMYLEAALGRELLSDRRRAVIYAQDPQSAEAALRVRRPFDSVVLIVHFNDSQAEEWHNRGYIERDSWLYRRIAMLERQVLPAVDEVVFVSRYMKERIESVVPGLDPRRCSIIPNFVDVPACNPMSEPGDLIAVGTLEPRKNQQYILRVMALLKQRGLTPSLTMVGGGEDQKALERLAQELDLASQVRFLGYVSNASSYLSVHRIQVHAALMENCPIALIEGLACGIPVVAARVGGMAEVVTEETGAFWDLTSIEDGANVLQTLLESPRRLKECSERARARYDLLFSPQICGSALLDVFERSLG